MSAEGSGCVALGSDWDGGIRPPAGLRSAADLPLLVQALRQQHYTDVDLRKIFGENFLRFFRAVTGPR